MLLHSTQRYGSLSIVMHWLMLALLAAVYSCIELRELFEKGSPPRELLKTWHFMLGLSVFALVWLRLLLRFVAPAPRIEPEPARWQKRMAGAMHAALYLLMIGMPVAGWLLLSAAGKPIPFFGLELPALLDADKALAGTIKDLHETGGKIGYGLIAAHAAAALVHHYLLRDNTLHRMLPTRG
jgi:superoxide oxidase